MEELFAGRSVYQHMTEQEMKVRTLVIALTKEDIEQRGTAAVVDGLLARCALVPPALDPDRMPPPTVEERGSSGAEVKVSVPFTGDRTLFFVRPSSVAVRLKADLQRTALVFSFASKTGEAADVRAEVDRILAEARKALAQLDSDLRPFSVSFRAAVQQEVEHHLEVLNAARAQASGLAGGKRST